MEYIKGIENVSFDAILALYNSVGWSAYTNKPDSLREALNNSTYIVICMDEEELVGLARSISDDVSIHYLQDILVNPLYHRKGIGRKLLEKCLLRFEHVRTHMILTDNEKKQKIFYESLGFKNCSELKETALNTFVRMRGVDLK